MIALEIKCLMELYKDFQRLVDLKLASESNKIKLIKQIDSLEKSDVQTVGFFKKKNKKEKIQDLQNALKQCKDKIELYKRLLVVSSDIIMGSQIELIKKVKQKRFKQMMDNFAHEQLDQISKEKALWEELMKSNNFLLEVEDNHLTKDLSEMQNGQSEDKE